MTTSIDRDEAAENLLATTLKEICDDGTRADTKAGHLGSLFSAMFGATVAVAKFAGLPSAATILLWASAVPMIAALVRLLAVVRPWMGPAAPFRRYAHRAPKEIADGFRVSAADPLVYLADRLRAHAESAERKLRGIRHAVNLVLLGIPGLVAAGVVAAVLG